MAATELSSRALALLTYIHEKVNGEDCSTGLNPALDGPWLWDDLVELTQELQDGAFVLIESKGPRQLQVRVTPLGREKLWTSSIER